MEKTRKKQIRFDAIIKVQNFLLECKKLIEEGVPFSTDNIARSLKMSRSAPKHAFDLGILKRSDVKGYYLLGENFSTDRNTAKKIIERARLQDIERRIVKSMEFTNNSLGLTPAQVQNIKKEQDEVPEIKRDTEKEITSLLKRALNSANPISNPSLFSFQEKEFEEKLKIACAIASGQYSHEFNGYSSVNDWIIEATNDLYLKLKNNK